MAKKIKNIFYSSRFEKSFNKLPLRIKRKAIKLEKIFRDNCFDPKLETHRLQGKYKNYLSFSVTFSHRIVFEFYNRWQKTPGYQTGVECQKAITNFPEGKKIRKSEFSAKLIKLKKKTPDFQSGEVYKDGVLFIDIGTHGIYK